MVAPTLAARDDTCFIFLLLIALLVVVVFLVVLALVLFLLLLSRLLLLLSSQQRQILCHTVAARIIDKDKIRNAHAQSNASLQHGFPPLRLVQVDSQTHLKQRGGSVQLDESLNHGVSVLAVEINGAKSGGVFLQAHLKSVLKDVSAFHEPLRYSAGGLVGAVAGVLPLDMLCFTV